MPKDGFQAFMQRLAQATSLRSQADLASFLDLHRSSISRAKQRDTVPQAWISRICQAFDLDPCWLAHGEPTSPNLCLVPKVQARLGAGGGSYLVDSETEGEFAFRRDWLRKKGQPERMLLMQVLGDSMEPVIREGDTVLIDRSQQELSSGGIYALGLEETILVKRLEKRPGALVLISANPAYAPIHLQGEELHSVRLIGRVVGMWRDFC
ncbi:MAG: S24 family peptidase [Desulfohalobiaceae bacterium]